MGQQRESTVLSDSEKERVAFHESGHALYEHRLQPVAQRAQPRRLGLTLGHGDLGGRGEPDGERHVLGARPAAAVLRSAVKERLDGRAAPDEQRAAALGRADLVSRDGQDIERHRGGVDGHLAECLDGVGVEHDAARPGGLGELGHGLDGADLVVHPHHRRHRHVVPHQRIERRAIDDAVGRHGEQALVGALMGGGVHGLEHRLVFHGRGDDRRLAALARPPPGPEHGEIVRLGAARGEADLVGVRAEAAGHALARLIQGGARLAAPAMHAGGVAEPRAVERPHGVEHLRAHRGRG
ncbi:MAG: hypothetical protein B7Z72_12070 [Gemmatimonadetes bacterium 21-71-4]|nr:MAG: hypothetical protein B7Z72_12070 [Gemmatimonadetes bacterium 21-71-4]